MKKSRKPITKSKTSAVNQMLKGKVEHYFTCPIYIFELPEFLPIVNKVSEENLATQPKVDTLNEIYPVRMTNNYFADPRLEKFCSAIGQTSWQILYDQGYDVTNRYVNFVEMWTQEHFKYSLMEQHVHGYGAQLNGFYFLQVPLNSSRILFYDPRPGKVQINLPERNMYDATYASNIINFQPVQGSLIITNSTLPHSFSRNASDKPIKFVHMTMSVSENIVNNNMETPNTAKNLQPVEII